METLGKYALLEQLSSAETSDIFFAKPIGSDATADGLIVKRLKPLVGGVSSAWETGTEAVQRRACVCCLGLVELPPQSCKPEQAGAK